MSGNLVQADDLTDPFDPFDTGSPFAEYNSPETTAEDLIREGSALLANDRPLDARTKLLQALKKDPKQYRAYYLLSGYYMVTVGHYRLALRYLNRAFELFLEKYGKPPYSETVAQLEHAHMLYYLSQVKLNLDDYQGALEALDLYTSFGYFDDWYPSSRAWILMKLGKLDEAIRVARLGMISGAEQGRVLNMLGILLSMKDQREESLEIFRKAVAAELALGSEGNPATPLNNAGEVYKEIFNEEKAEASWLRAISLPDGCEHVLPSLNLVLLYIDQLNFEGASKTIDDFEGCFAQFTLKNDEEHKALVLMARGRIALHSGQVKKAIKDLDVALDSIQWFGKIGTSQDDLRAGVMISLAQALDRRAQMIALELTESWTEWISLKQEALEARLRSWWLNRRAREILLEDLEDIEDLKIRNTDSMIEYTTLGELLATYPKGFIEARLTKQSERDPRKRAKIFYQAYLLESSLGWFHKEEALRQIDDLIAVLRPKAEDLLKLHLLTLKQKHLEGSAYLNGAYQIFKLSPPHLRNSGFKLPITLRGDKNTELRHLILEGPFMLSDTAPCSIELSGNEQDGFNAKFACQEDFSKTREIGDKVASRVVNRLADAVFSEEFAKSKGIRSLF
jgi:tetratricopeptide (TPR) repeat protein